MSLKRFLHITSLLLVAATGLLTVPCWAENTLEAKVKSAYLFNLTRFVEWPSNTGDGNTLLICVTGSDQMTSMISELAGRQVKDRTLKVETDRIADPARCQVLYIGRDERKAQDLLSRTRGRSVLTVSDRDEFAQQGGIVGFYEDGGKLRLEINTSAARNANLRLSAKLLEVSRVVKND